MLVTIGLVLIGVGGTILPNVDKDRGKDYNHSTFIDIIIAGLVGLRAAFGKLLVVGRRGSG